MAEADKVDNSELTLLGHFFKDIVRNKDDWCMQCTVCKCKIKSRPTITSNFHRHLRVSGQSMVMHLCYLGKIYGRYVNVKYAELLPT